MSVIVSGRYLGNKKVELQHDDSGAIFVTDAPLDHAGEGKSFSPTDLLTAALGSCVLTVMAIVAERDGIDLSGMRMRAEKMMIGSPRRIGGLNVDIWMPARLVQADRDKLERVAKACPVHQSLAGDIAVELRFCYEF